MRSSASTRGGRGWKGRANRRNWGEDGLTPLAISPRRRLDDAVRAVSDLPFGGTNCALPMRYGREVDMFVV
jgi:60 kDa SS-A/Ro ribonucleoprotein